MNIHSNNCTKGDAEDSLIRMTILEAGDHTPDHGNSPDEMDSYNPMNSKHQDFAKAGDIASSIGKPSHYDLAEDKNGYCFLLFLAAVERGSKVVEAIAKDVIKNEDKLKVDNFDFTIHENAVVSIKVVNQALKYLLSKTAVEALRHLLDYCKNNFVIPTVIDISILELVCDYTSVKARQSMKLLLANEIIISYQEAKDHTLELLAQGVKEKSSVSALVSRQK